MEKAEVYRREDGLFDWRVRAANGEIVATSGGQGFTERNDARAAVERSFPILGVEELDDE